MSLDTQSPPKVSVAIVGAGLGGLAIAAFLRTCPQYSVAIYERRPQYFIESSAAIGLRMSGISIVKQLGINRQDIRAVIGTGYRTFNLREELMSESYLDVGPDGDGTMWYALRQDLWDLLLRKVTAEDGPGEPVKVFYESRIVDTDADTGFLGFEDGSSVEVDLIIGADGIKSKVRTTVVPPSHPLPSPAGVSLYRFILPMQVIHDAIGTDQPLPPMYNYDSGAFVAAIATSDGGHRHAFMYPCRGYEQMSFIIAVPDSTVDDPAKLQYSWHAKGSVKEMVDGMVGFPDWLKRVLSPEHTMIKTVETDNTATSLTPPSGHNVPHSRTPTVQLFQVRDQEPLPTYIRSRVVLIGDAAHAMVPYQGQGGNQALEDVEALYEVLRDVHDTADLPSRLALYDRVRRPRATAFQRSARVAQGEVATSGAAKAILNIPPWVRMREAVKAL